MKNRIIFMSLLTFLLFSCSENIYVPMWASVLGNDVLLSYADSSGNDLLKEEGFIKQVKIYGVLSKKELPFTVKKIELNGMERSCLSFNADLPDEKSMQFNGENEATGTSTLKLSLDGQDLTLLCSFKYSSRSIPGLLGGSSIGIEEISYKKERINRQDGHSLNSDFLLCIERKGKDFTLK